GGAASAGEWLVAAIREAVGSGSRFVAPKRIREILSRWAASPEDRPASLRPRSEEAAPSGGSTLAGSSQPSGSEDGRPPQPDTDDDSPAIDAGWSSVWTETSRRLARSLDREEMERIFAGSAIVAARRDSVTIVVRSVAASEKIRGEYAGIVTRCLSQAASRPLSFDVVLAGDITDGDRDPRSESNPAGLAASSRNRSQLGQFVLPGGLTGRQLWAAAQADLAKRVSSASFESWVRPARLLARDESGALILGAPNAFARSRLEPLLDDIQRSLSGILGAGVSVRLVVTGSWLGESSGEWTEVN
ncbi:MAG TPA: DnaA N-terminal domain-containing protein, partial [Thermomicrobiaceae bacterium]|nr:DnaA N-terminal domain-containing protein [Thermomicrobiaceae bacterium]